MCTCMLQSFWCSRIYTAPLLQTYSMSSKTVKLPPKVAVSLNQRCGGVETIFYVICHVELSYGRQSTRRRVLLRIQIQMALAVCQTVALVACCISSTKHRLSLGVTFEMCAVSLERLHNSYFSFWFGNPARPNIISVYLLTACKSLI